MNRLVIGQMADNEDSVIINVRPDFNRICYNSIRASIIHLLIKNKDLNYTCSVEEMSKKLGKRHSVVIHHLEKLSMWKIVDVVRSVKYGSGERRSIWGLNMKYPNLVQSIYTYMLKTFYTPHELDKMCCIDTNVRKAMVIAGALMLLSFFASDAVVLMEMA